MSATLLMPQLIVVGLLALAIILFIRNRLRYDVIALLLMLGVIGTGLLTPETVFANFGHSAIIIIASMFVMSEAFIRSGMVDVIVDRLSPLYTKPPIALAVLILLVMVISAFVNNAGALAMTIPIAIHLARKSHTPIALFLLPLAFASHLGGFTTLIGTPRNLIISEFRADAVGTPFGMFDFLPVGGLLALAGGAFLIMIAWRLLPNRGNQQPKPIIRHYTTEMALTVDSPIIGITCQELKQRSKNELEVISIHTGTTTTAPNHNTKITAENTINIRGTIAALIQAIRKHRLVLTGLRAHEHFVKNGNDHTTREVVVPPYAKLVGSNWDTIPLPKRFGVNLLGIFRRDQDLTAPLSQTVFWPSDILVLQGQTDTINETIDSLQLLPIDEPEINLGQRSSSLITGLLLLLAIVIATAQIIPIEVVFFTTALLLILLNLVTLRQAYESIDQTVLILIAGMLTLGEALQTSGAAVSISNFILRLDAYVGAPFLLAIVLAISMLLADFMNTNASAVVMAPIAIATALSLGVSVDPFLMAVAVGSSCAFLTPIGHEANAMVMRQGGYTFGDYFKVGLPLEIIIFLISLPAIMYFWPL